MSAHIDKQLQHMCSYQTMKGTNVLYGMLTITAWLHTSEGLLLEQMVNRGEFEVVRPIRLHRRYSRDTKLFRPDEVKYRLKLNGKDLEIHLHKNRELISKDYTETLYTKGTRVTTPYAHDKNQCYYLGKIAGDTRSAASISTCQGLSGFIRAAGQEYVIEPLTGTDTGDHAVVKYRNLRRVQFHCGVDNATLDHELPSFPLRGSSRTTSPLDIQKYIETFLVVDHSEYLMMQEDTDKTRRRMFEIMNFVNMVYKPLRTAVILVGLEIWTDSDQIPVDENSSSTLNNFNAWRNNVLVKIRKHDNAQLITAVQFSGGVFGTAFVETVCSNHSTGVVQDHNMNVILTASTYAHELGHNLGMRHDSGRHCSCVEAECIMASTLSDSALRHFSSCSVESYTSFLERSDVMTYLTVNPFHGTVIPVCGNGFQEEGEQCDCGSPEECTNPCCDAMRCLFIEGAQCDKGECCEDCKFIQFTRQCRAQADECDLPEYCTGSSADCPEDTFLQNGRPCSDDTGYCLNGRCPTRAKQCKAGWGNDTQVAEDHCYPSDSVKDALCEMLLCITGNKDQNTRSNHTCTDVISAHKNLDHNLVLNGTKCDEGKVCISKKCVALEKAYAVNNCNENCTGHKVCNSKLECQCEAGWIPPNCDRMYQWDVDLTESQPSGLETGAVIAIVVVTVVTVVTLVVLALVKIVWFCRNNEKRNSQQSHSSNTPKLGLGNSAFNKEQINVYAIDVDPFQAPPNHPHPFPYGTGQQGTTVCLG